MSEAITSKLESIISGHKVNADDADWLRAALSQPTRHLTVTTVESGEAVMVSWQDEDHRILEVVWERKGPSPQPAVPVVSDEQIDAAIEAWFDEANKDGATFKTRMAAAIAAVNGITAKAEGGAKP